MENEGGGTNWRMILLIGGALVAAYLVYRYISNRGGGASSGNTGDTGGTLTTGNTTLDKGAVTITVTQNQPQPPTMGKTTTHSRHQGPQAVSRVNRSKPVQRRIHQINNINEAYQDKKKQPRKKSEVKST